MVLVIIPMKKSKVKDFDFSKTAFLVRFIDCILERVDKFAFCPVPP